MFMMGRGSRAALKTTCGCSPLTSNCIRNHLGGGFGAGAETETEEGLCLYRDVSVQR